jgi:hypothetical protein
MSSRLGDHLKIGQGRTSGTSFFTLPKTLLARPLQFVSFGDRPSAPARDPGGGRAWRRRQVVVAFDSNVATNAKVRRANWAFREMLVSRDADVFRVDWPQHEGVNGLDDLIALRGEEAM